MKRSSTCSTGRSCHEVCNICTNRLCNGRYHLWWYDPQYTQKSGICNNFAASHVVIACSVALWVLFLVSLGVYLGVAALYPLTTVHPKVAWWSVLSCGPDVARIFDTMFNISFSVGVIVCKEMALIVNRPLASCKSFSRESFAIHSATVFKAGMDRPAPGCRVRKLANSLLTNQSIFYIRLGHAVHLVNFLRQERR